MEFIVRRIDTDDSWLPVFSAHLGCSFEEVKWHVTTFHALIGFTYQMCKRVYFEDLETGKIAQIVPDYKELDNKEIILLKLSAPSAN